MRSSFPFFYRTSVFENKSMSHATSDQTGTWETIVYWADDHFCLLSHSGYTFSLSRSLSLSIYIYNIKVKLKSLIVLFLRVVLQTLSGEQLVNWVIYGSGHLSDEFFWWVFRGPGHPTDEFFIWLFRVKPSETSLSVWFLSNPLGGQLGRWTNGRGPWWAHGVRGTCGGSVRSVVDSWWARDWADVFQGDPFRDRNMVFLTLLHLYARLKVVHQTVDCDISFNAYSDFIWTNYFLFGVVFLYSGFMVLQIGRFSNSECSGIPATLFLWKRMSAAGSLRNAISFNMDLFISRFHSHIP